ncbi:two-component system aerobic respiration control sensor histidine kinase ArcB [Mesocricetibacter intestinalis]|uniref:Aerobic respiration control sensor protein n=1 Tax=Mesocricetibacter intestinalis TaxID=1521930 RepID=A0A4R6VFB1_9PAST|nr:ATP-binding protein [Mesocricetibacter intestinalis]TDQ59675.1 two-component system aerobic respiration control sensor histidine kinase ArcB [Mesocricetibacter intestinalis]
MKNVKHFAQRYVDWVIKLGRLKFSLLGFIVIAALALCTHIIMSLLIVGEIHWRSLSYAILFGLISTPFVIYFFTLLVERLELSRLHLARSVKELQQEIKDRILAEQRLAQANDNKTRLMATISHELRTPLNGIMGLTRILLDTELSEQQRNYLNTINVSAVSLGNIFNDIIDFEKIDAQRIELYRTETDFYSFLNDIHNICRLMAEQKHLQFKMHYAKDFPSRLMLDTTRLSQILWNLMSNATKFTEKGEINLEIKRVGASEYHFIVQDTGQGIPQQELDKIFAMHYQVDSRFNKHKPAGSGIGLAISKTLAELMGGSLQVHSVLGEGSTFILSIQAEIAPQSEVEISHAGVSRLHILLVEDVELNILVAQTLLEKLGNFVDVARSGQEAIEKFERSSYDLVLLDILLPDMSGFDIAHRLRQNYEQDRYEHLPPLIALTANLMQDKEEYRRKGMDDVLRKPLLPEALIACLKEHFGEERESLGVAVYNRLPKEEKSALDFIDFSILEELIDMLGVAFARKSLALFAQTMPDYMEELQNAYRSYQEESTAAAGVADCAHKIKGAAASVGLKRIRELAERAQHRERADWSHNIGELIAELARCWKGDTESLENYLQRI